MDDILKPVKTTRNIKSKIEQFETLNSSHGTLSNRSTSAKNLILEVDENSTPLPESKSPPTNDEPIKASGSEVTGTSKRNSTAFHQQSYLGDRAVNQVSGLSLADDAREILKSQPNQEDLAAVLAYLQYGIDGKQDFNIKVTASKSAQILNVLVANIIPDVWPNFQQQELSEQEYRMKQTIISCLSCTAGIGALIAQIRQSSTNSSSSSALRITFLLAALSDVLKGHKIILRLLSDTQLLYKNENQRRLSWQDMIAFIAGGRVLSTAAQAVAAAKAQEVHVEQLEWLGDGKEYNRWLGKNIVQASVKLQTTDKEAWNWLGLLLKRAFSLGHRETLVNEIYSSLILGSKALWTPLHQLLSTLSDYDQKLLFDTVLVDLSVRCFGGTSAIGFTSNQSTNQAISAYAALVSGLIGGNETLREHLEEWLIVANASYASIGLASRRALIAVLASSESEISSRKTAHDTDSTGSLESILDRVLTNFSDKLQIQHASSLQQDAQAQTVLLAISYLRRTAPAVLKTPHISSLSMRSVSNRLGASVPRARFLGMIVGTAMSKATDSPGQVLDFGVEEMETEEAEAWLHLIDIHDTIAKDIDPRKLFLTNPPSFKQYNTARRPQTSRPALSTVPKTEIVSIEEVTDSESEDEDLIPYGKPDSDAEDSDDDPTLINRSKPSAPVYIVDLIKQLQMDDKPEVIDLALRTAPGLIRRKIGFGTELSDNLHTLASVLVNLHEGMDEEHLHTLRLQSLIACVVANPGMIAPSLAALYFEGDFSVAQRVVLLSVIGLSARELAGFSIEDTAQGSTGSSHLVESSSSSSSSSLFPSKRLPAHLQPLSSPSPFASASASTSSQNPISALTTAQAQSMIRPMALAAADKMTGPSALKIRTFSSRMQVQKQTQQKIDARQKRIPKHLHSLLVTAFYMPLCTRMAITVSSTSSLVLQAHSSLLQPSLLRMVLQTLTLVLHTLGPAASMHLPVLTHETLLLLLSIHTGLPGGISTDPLVLPALLHLMLALMDVTIEAGYTAQERLITDHGAQVSELVTWANGLGDRISIPDVDEAVDGGMPWSVLAAGIQVKWFEMGQRFQGRMLGLVDT